MSDHFGAWYDNQFPPLPESNRSPTRVWCKMHIASTFVTRVFTIQSVERNVSVGESMRTCQIIMQKTNASIEIWITLTVDELTFLVTGKPNEVVQARRMILVHFNRKSICIPREHHRWILGKKGARLRELEKTTATKINVPLVDTKKNIITISGSKEGIKTAEIELRRIEQIPKAFERVKIPKIYHPFIVGPHSKNVNKMMEETGAKINIPPPTVQKDEIIITGEKKGVLQAKARIDAINKEMEKKCTSVDVEIPCAQHKNIVGPKGSTIQEILDRTGVSVEIPLDSQNDTITLRGPQENLEQALSIVYEKANSVCTKTLICPQWIKKYIIGRKGTHIKKCTAQYSNVQVDFSKQNVEIRGEPVQVDACAGKLECMVQDLTGRLTFTEMMVDSIYFKYIIGKNGANIKRMQKEYEVLIIINEKKPKPIRIEGSAEGVERAKQELLKNIMKLENEKEKSIVIDHRLFNTIIGTKGETIREIRDKHNQVQIICDLGPNDNSDLIKIRGPRENVDKCSRYLAKYVKEFVVMKVPIIKQYHKFIIGKGGAKIKEIRNETETNIDLPAEDDKNDVIVITGKKKNVREARNRIRKIQEEKASQLKHA